MSVLLLDQGRLLLEVQTWYRGGCSIFRLLLTVNVLLVNCSAPQFTKGSTNASQGVVQVKYLYLREAPGPVCGLC